MDLRMAPRLAQRDGVRRTGSVELAVVGKASEERFEDVEGRVNAFLRRNDGAAARGVLMLVLPTDLEGGRPAKEAGEGCGPGGGDGG